MATIQKRTNAEGDIAYHVRVRLRGHPTQTCTFSRLTDAREWAHQPETAIREGRYFKTAEAKSRRMIQMLSSHNSNRNGTLVTRLFLGKKPVLHHAMRMIGFLIARMIIDNNKQGRTVFSAVLPL
jgi:hypothetical protein